MKETTLAHHLDKLDHVEKGLVIWALNMTKHLGYEVHRGMLPFVNVHDAIAALDKLCAPTPAHNKGRIFAKVRFTLRQAYNISDATLGL